MSLIDEVRKLHPTDFVVTVGIFVAIIAPGFLTIHLYKPTLVSSLDSFKLIIFCSALTLPVVAVNFFGMAIFADDKDRPEFLDITIASLALACAVLYTSLIGSYLFTLSFRWHLGLIAAMQVAALFISYVAQCVPKKP